MPQNTPTTFALLKARRPDRDSLFDLLVRDGKIAAFGPAGSVALPAAIETIDAGGLLLFPSFIDAHTHLREPGFEYKENITTGLEAALHGGFGHVLCMANTSPVNDNAAITSFMLDKARQSHPHGPSLHPVGALSIELEGLALAPMGELAEHGVVAISNDGKPVQNNELFRRAVEYAATWNLKVIDHCEDAFLSSGAQMNEGPNSAELGLKGQPCVGESLQVARDILLAEYLGLPIHLAHISCRLSLDLIRWGKARGVRITAETCPHYLVLDDSALLSYNTLFKVSPPLRGQDDMLALREAVADGTIDILATDHAPHAAHEKDVPFDEAPNGLIGLETALSITYSLVRVQVISEARLEELWSGIPASIFNIAANRFAPGDPANFFLFDPQTSWVVNRESIHSRSLNTPWLGQTLHGKVSAHWLKGVKLL